MSSVGSSSPSLSLVDLNMIDHQLLHIKSFDLSKKINFLPKKPKFSYIGIGLEVLKQTQYHLDRLFWPSALDDTEFDGLACAADVTSEAAVGNASSVGQDVLQVLNGFL